MKKFLALSLSDVVFIMLINVKMPTIVGILTFMSRINFVLSWVEHGKSFITSGPVIWQNYSPCTFWKASGILLLPVHLSVDQFNCFSIMLSHKLLDQIKTNLLSDFLTQVEHARAHLFLPLLPHRLGTHAINSRIFNGMPSTVWF